jgi:putative ATP-dependent endonuclease of OLD family
MELATPGQEGLLPEAWAEAAERLLPKIDKSWDTVTSDDFEIGVSAAQQIWDVLISDAKRGGVAVLKKQPPRFPGGGAQRLIPLILLYAWLRARGPGVLDSDAHPIAVFDHVEASLHPTVVNSFWYAIDRVPVQKILTTNSGEILANVPLHSIRRLVRSTRQLKVHRLGPTRLSKNDYRKVTYHIKAKRGNALFGRCWLLIEGETEFWLLPEFAQAKGYELQAEGVACVEFAQCGLSPLIKLADDLGIEWHLLADGDEAGDRYVRTAVAHLRGRPKAQRITCLPYPSIEHLLWASGYAEVYWNNLPGKRQPKPPHHPSEEVLEKVVRLRSKPYLAQAVLEVAAGADSPGVPAVLDGLFDKVVNLARGGN